MAAWSIPFFVAAFTALLMSYGVIGNADPQKAFDWATICLLVGAFFLVKWNAMFRLFQGGDTHAASGHMEKTGTPEHHGSKSGNRFGWVGKGLAGNLLATASVVGWVLVFCSLWSLYMSDEPFWPTVWLMVTFHVAVAFSLAWAGKLGKVMDEITNNHKAFAWIWLSSLAAILAATHGYEEGFMDWWLYPPFLVSILSILLAGMVAAGLHEKAFKSAGKAYFEWHGTGSMILWGFTLVLVPFLLYAASGHEFFDLDVQEAAFGLKWVIAAGFFLVVFSPVFFLAKKIR